MKKIRVKRVGLIVLTSAVGLFLLGTAGIVLDGLNDELGKADLALVLGNKVEPDGQPSSRLRARLDRALDLYQAGYFPTVVVSGGKSKEGHDEATTMRDYLVTRGVPSQHIILDSAGINTFASAKNTAALMEQQKLRSVMVISQYFHITRAKLALRRFNIVNLYSAHAHFFEPRDIYSTFRETVGYISYFLRSKNQV
jgi:vancomycin permeability regulator SanA